MCLCQSIENLDIVVSIVIIVNKNIYSVYLKLKLY